MPQGYYPRPTVAQRLVKHSKRMANGCLEWTGHRDKDGYGDIGIKGANKRAHRVAWEEVYGPIPMGMKVCHHCDNPPCIDVEHLFVGTTKDNSQDASSKGRLAGINTGERNGQHVHSDVLVKAVREDYRRGVKQVEICRKYYLPKPTVSMIVNNKTRRTTI